MNPFTPAEIFIAIAQLSWRASWLIALVLALRVLFRGRLPADVWFWAWIVVGLRLLLPFSVPTSASPYNWSHGIAASPALTSRAPSLVPIASTASSAVVAPPVALELASAVAPAPVTGFAVKGDAGGAVSPTRPIPWGAVIAGVWLTISLAIVLVRIVATARFARRLRSCQLLDDARLHGIVASEAERIGLRVVPSCIETDEVQAPALFGLRQPALLFPRGLVARLSDEELRLVVLHELGHHRRRDLVSHAILHTAASVHWFNPLVWAATRLARTDCELACDAFVLRNGRTSLEAYGAALLRVVGATRATYRPGAIVVSMVESKQQLARRVRMIAEFRRPARWQSVVAAAVVGALAAIGATRETRAETLPGSTPEVARTSPAKDAGTTTISARGESSPAVSPVAEIRQAATSISGPRDADALRAAVQQDANARTATLRSSRTDENLGTIDDRRDMFHDRIKRAAMRRDDLQRDLNVLDTRLKLLSEYRQRNGDVATLPFIGGDGLVQRLQEQIARQKIDVATLLHRYGERHPEVVRGTQAVQELSTGLEAAIDAAAQRLQAERDKRAAELRVATAEFSRVTDETLAFESEVAEAERRKLAAQDRDAALRPLSLDKKGAATPDAATALRAGDFSVSVVGAVNHQAGVAFSAQDKPMVLDAIARAGGFTSAANRSGVRILRLQPDGTRRSIALSESEVMAGMGEAAHIQRGDAIIVPERPALQYVTLLGAVNVAGRMELPGADQPKMTLIELLRRAGGATRLADLRHVRITRAPGGTAGSDTQVVNLADVLSGKTPTPSDLKSIELEPGDVITIPERVL